MGTTCTVLLGVLVLASTAIAQLGAKLEGPWKATAAERDGKTLYTGPYRTAQGQPAPIDLENESDRLKGTWEGIYRLDGTSLRICDNAPDMSKPRPTALAAPAGSGHVCIDFVRAGS